MKTQYIIIAALAVAAYFWWDKLKAAVLLTPGAPAVGTPANNQIAVGEPNAPIPDYVNWIPAPGEIAATNPSMFV
jgi:hypothetical protein